MATQNPIEYEGTFPLPEAQLDRFLIRVHLGYPSPTDEVLVLDAQQTTHPVDDLGQVTDANGDPAAAAGGEGDLRRPVDQAVHRRPVERDA